MDILKNSKHIHFIGIGGIGMSALARLFLHEGKKVTGSDATESAIIDDLRKLGATVTIGQSGDNIDETVDVVVYTVAIAPNNPELVVTQERGLPVYTYAEALGKVSEGKYTVAVAGTHGKTTTTAMITKVAVDAEKSPTVVVGSLLKEPRTNFIAGDSDLFIVEACEYKRSFLNLHPNILVITNIEEDHLDYYKDLADIQNAFTELVKRIPQDGYLVCNPAGAHMKPIVEVAVCTVVDYTEYESIPNLKVPGNHNRDNTKAALAVAKLLLVEKEKAVISLQGFAGTWRRFEYKGETAKGTIVYDDYAHHPTEIKATLAGAREFFGEKKIIVVFQPHLYSRTRDLFLDFTHAFADANQVILAPIYAAREPLDRSVSSEMLSEAILKAGMASRSEAGFSEIIRVLEEGAERGDVVITMGAGDVFKVADGILK